MEAHLKAITYRQRRANPDCVYVHGIVYCTVHSHGPTDTYLAVGRRRRRRRVRRLFFFSCFVQQPSIVAEGARRRRTEGLLIRREKGKRKEEGGIERTAEVLNLSKVRLLHEISIRGEEIKKHESWEVGTTICNEKLFNYFLFFIVSTKVE